MCAYVHVCKSIPNSPKPCPGPSVPTRMHIHECADIQVVCASPGSSVPCTGVCRYTGGVCLPWDKSTYFMCSIMLSTCHPHNLHKYTQLRMCIHIGRIRAHTHTQFTQTHTFQRIRTSCKASCSSLVDMHTHTHTQSCRHIHTCIHIQNGPYLMQSIRIITRGYLCT